MTEVKWTDHKNVYANLGIDVSKLGCIMLDLDPIIVTDLVDQGKADLYSSVHSDRYWISGAVAENKAHITLLYGLLSKGQTWKGLVDEVLTGWDWPQLTIQKVSAFPSMFDDEPYSCIIAEIKISPELLEGHQRLSLLPHINTFGEYKAHVTLAYVKQEAEAKWVKALNKNIKGTLSPVKLNYGGKH